MSEPFKKIGELIYPAFAAISSATIEQLLNNQKKNFFTFTNSHKFYTQV